MQVALLYTQSERMLYCTRQATEYTIASNFLQSPEERRQTAIDAPMTTGYNSLVPQRPQ